MKKAIVAYIPVLHEGYRRFFDAHKDAQGLFIINEAIAKSFVPLAKDIRALPPETIAMSLKAWNIFKSIRVADETDIRSLADADEVVMPDDEVMRSLASLHLPDANVVFDPAFLRWDKHKATEKQSVQVDQIVSRDKKDRDIVLALFEEAEKSSDWWRHVAAGLVKDGKVISISHNTHVPSEYMPYVDGDPRAEFSKGVNLELSTAIHAEALLIADAARQGISLDGASLYVTTFPCPPCAKLIAYSGIKKLYYAGGYGVLDGERVLKANGVEIIFVETE